MNETAEATANEAVEPPKETQDAVKLGLWKFFMSELRPKGPIFTPFNLISAPIIGLGAILIVYRFAMGLGAATNLNQDFPWGLWIGFDVVTGVAFAGGAYVLTFAVYVMGAEKYHSIIRATVLNGFLAYVFYAGALLLDLGRPWNVINPIIGNDFGYNSVLFLVAWHFLLYMIAEFIEFSPAIAEWAGYKKLRKILHSMTLAAVIFGITLSTLHQSGLGALFMMAKGKIHPLWYTEFIPLLFFISSIFAGLSLVIVEGSLTHKVFSSHLSEKNHHAFPGILVGLARGCAVAMFSYLFLKGIVFIHDHGWEHIFTGWGAWFLVEVIGFVLIPMVMFVEAARSKNIVLVRWAAGFAAIGVILNRLNISVIAYKWDAPFHYYPSAIEVIVTAAIILIEIWVFRWVINRMPVLREPPAWAKDH